MLVLVTGRARPRDTGGGGLYENKTENENWFQLNGLFLCRAVM